MEQENCGLCKYLKLDTLERTVCKRFPKSESKNGNDYCGEFKESKTAPDVLFDNMPPSNIKHVDAGMENKTIDVVQTSDTITDVQKRRGRPKKDNFTGENQ